jgi:Domain of unknown function (DUF4826)
MSPSCDEPDEATWCAAQRAEVTRYLFRESVNHRGIAERPAWHLCPYVSIWEIESALSPGAVGWWAIAGDLPTDYLSARHVKNARDAMREFARTWAELAPFVRSGRPHAQIRMGGPGPNPELAELLDARAAVLRDWAEDDDVWSEERESSRGG